MIRTEKSPARQLLSLMWRVGVSRRHYASAALATFSVLIGSRYARWPAVPFYGFAVADPVVRTARAVKRPVPRRESPPAITTAHVDDDRALDLKLRNPKFHAVASKSAVKLPPDLHGLEFASRDGTLDALVQQSMPFEWARPSSLARAEIERTRVTGPVTVVRDLPAMPCVWLTPTARYHTDELGPLRMRLASMGILAEFVLVETPSSGLLAELARYANRAFLAIGDEAVAGLTSASAIVVMNDWGQRVPLLRAAQHRGVPTFAKVEGAQDFRNRDTLRRTLPYRTADIVFCQGPYDMANVGERGVSVGSCRLEDLMSLSWGGLLEKSEDTVLANYNFSYGTRSYAADGWLKRVRESAAKAGRTLRVSTHPAVTPPLDVELCKWPLALELELASHIVTRSSTALFDAAALGRPVAYFTPHRERCWDDLDLGDAIPRLHTAGSLTEWLGQATPVSVTRLHEWLTTAFLSLEDDPCELRMAKVIAEQVA